MNAPKHEVSGRFSFGDVSRRIYVCGNRLGMVYMISRVGNPLHDDDPNTPTGNRSVKKKEFMKKMICLAVISASSLVFHQASADPLIDRERGPESEIRRQDDYEAYLRERNSERSFSRKHGAIHYVDGLSKRQFPQVVRINNGSFLVESKRDAKKLIARLSKRRVAFNVLFRRESEG